MSLILSGTDGLSDVDGTAATPAIRGTDTNTGIFFPAADTVAASVGGTEGLRLTTTGLTTQQDATVYGVRVGRGAGAVSTNTAVGASALAANTTGANNVAVGSQSLQLNTTGTRNSSLGVAALYANTTGAYNSALGMYSLFANTTGGFNSAFGYEALQANTTASNNTAVGYQAGYNATGAGNTIMGVQAGYSLSSGTYNNLFGYASTGYGAGGLITTGSKNTIIGGYSGNQGGLDIRTASNYIVLSDGDGNPRFIVSNSGNAIVGNNTGAPSTWVSGDYNGLEIGSPGNSIYGGQGGFNPIAMTSNAYVSSGGTTYTKPYSAASGVFRIQGTIFTWSTSSSTSTGQITDFVTALSLEQGKSLALQGATSQSGTGITFPATQSASSNANTLDDYERGSWTPSFSFASGAISSYGRQQGTYVKVGRLVTVSFYIDVSNIGTASGGMTLSGLPFNSDGTSQQYQEGFGRLNSIPSQSSPASGFVGFQLGPNQSYGDVQFAASTGINSVTAANLDTAWDCVGTITYIAVQ